LAQKLFELEELLGLGPEPILVQLVPTSDIARRVVKERGDLLRMVKVDLVKKEALLINKEASAYGDMRYGVWLSFDECEFKMVPKNG